MSKFSLVMAWLAATAIATLLTFAAVSFVAGDFTEGPRVEATLAGAAGPTSAPASTSASTSTSTMAPPAESESPSTTESESPTSTEQESPSTTESSSPSTTESSSPSTTEPESTSTSTTVPSEPTDTKVLVTEGGAISLSCLGSIVQVDWATPTSPYYYDPEVTMGSEVEVDFEWEDKQKIRVEARCSDGKVVATTEVDIDSD